MREGVWEGEGVWRISCGAKVGRRRGAKSFKVSSFRDLSHHVQVPLPFVVARWNGRRVPYDRSRRERRAAPL